MLGQYGPWLAVRKLGGGGQASVFLGYDSVFVQQLAKSFQSVARTIRADDWQDQVIQLWEDFSPTRKCRAAIKVFSQTQTSQVATARMEQEIKILKTIDNPYILKILDEDIKAGWYASEYCPGGALGQARDYYAGNSLKSLDLMIKIVGAVAVIHKAGLIHRDLKPDNIFLGEDGEPRVGDFGLAINTDCGDERLTQTMESVGTKHWKPEWMFGERMKDEDIDGVADVFALGKIFYCILSGREYLRLWYHRRAENDLNKIFPGDEVIPEINKILDGCIVEEKKSAKFPDAQSLLEALKDLRKKVGNGLLAHQFDFHAENPCVSCGVGKYRVVVDRDNTQLRNFGINTTGMNKFIIYSCGYCGHVQTFFSNDAKGRPKWKKSETG